MPFTVITPVMPPEDIANPVAFEIALRGIDHVQFPLENFNEHVKNYIATAKDEVKLFPPYDTGRLRTEFCLKFHKKKLVFHYTLSEADKKRGEGLREELGIPQGAEIVTLHVRESGYLENQAPRPGFFAYHDYRDANIDNYQKTIDYLTDKGFYVVRIGDRSMKPLPTHPMVVDAPHHPKYTPFVEPYFCAVNKFYLGMNSGPQALAVGFGVPILHTNVLIQSANYTADHDLYVYKKYYAKNLDRFLTLEEVFLSHLINCYFNEEYEKSEIQLLENTPEEILASTREMLARLDGTYEENTALQSGMRVILKKSHHLQEAMCEKYPLLPMYLSKAKVSTEFLKMNPKLMGVHISGEHLYKFYVQNYCLH